MQHEELPASFHVWVPESDSAFCSYQQSFGPWLSSRETIPLWQGADEPAYYIHDIGEERCLPKRISPWLLSRPVASDSSETYEQWRTAAVSKLLLVLASETRMLDSRCQVAVKGNRKVVLTFSAPLTVSQEEYLLVAQAVRWVFDSPDHVDTKHALLSGEILAHCQQIEVWDLSVLEVLPKALHAAKDSFRFHLLNESKEALKLLADLRKMLADEVDRVAKYGDELVSQLWKDFAIVLGAVVLQFLPKARDLHLHQAVPIGAGVLIITQYLLRLYANRRNRVLAAEERVTWQARVYSYLGAGDYKRLVEDPIAKRWDTYRRTVLWIWGLYVLLFIGLAVIAFGSVLTVPDSNVSNPNGNSAGVGASNPHYQLQEESTPTLQDQQKEESISTGSAHTASASD